MITLTVKGGAISGRTFSFTKPSVRIGGPGTDLDLSFDPWVSDLHCEVSLAGNVFTVTDLGSANGTRVGSPSAVAIPPNVAVPIPPGADLVIGGQLLSIAQPEVTPARRSGIGPALRSTRPMASSRPGSSPQHMTGPVSAIVRSSSAARKTRAGAATPAAGSDAVIVEPLAPDDDPAEAYAEHEGRSCLLFVSGLHEGRAVFLGVLPVTVGRAESNQVPLVDAMAAPLHCTITPVGGGAYEVRPLAENAPVRVNRSRITAPKRLEDEDLIGIGSHEIRFLDARAPAQKEGAAPPEQALFTLDGAVHRRVSVGVGSAAGSELLLRGPDVEDAHARIWWEGTRFVLRDGSRAGVFVNGRRAVEHVIADGDVAEIGGFSIAFEVQGRRLAAEVTPPRAPAPPASRWKLPRDLLSRTRERAALLAGAAAALLVLVGLQTQGTGAFVERPVSPAHASPAFTAQVAAKLGGAGGGGCKACHAGLDAASPTRCASCHGGEVHPLRAGHVKAIGAAGCIGCHTEHLAAESAPRLVDGAKCASCHPKRHQQLLPAEKGPVVVAIAATPTIAARRAAFGVDLKADLAFTAPGRHRALHEKHLLISGSCTACHPAGADDHPERAYRSCFGCHGPLAAEQALGAGSRSCSDCHREHGPDHAWATARSRPGEGRAAGGSFAGWMLAALVPLGLFGLWRARGSKPAAAPAAAPARQEEGALLCPDGVPMAKARRLPVLIPSRCVGAGDCAAACPYGVLELGPDRRPKVVKPEACHECGACVEKCGPGALALLVPGEPLPLVDRPALDAHYETSVDGSDGGVYVVGEAAAKPGIKHAINLGHAVVQHVAGRGLVPGAAQRLGCDVEIVVIGSGPAGLSAALAAQERGFSAIVFERRHVVAGTIHDYPKGKTVQVAHPEARKVGALWFERDATREELLAEWGPAVAKLNLRYGEAVERMRHENGAFTVTTTKGAYRALRVVVAVGGKGEPRRLGKPGEELAKVRHALVDPAPFAGKKVTVVGGGPHAVAAAIALARAGAEVDLVHRQKDLGSPELYGAGVRTHPETQVVEIRDKSVLLDRPPGELPSDAVFVLLGTTTTAQWLERLGLEMTKKSLSWEPP